VKRAIQVLALALLLTANARGQGTILWDESVNGPLSNDGGNPTSLQPLAFGTNSVIGSVQLTPVGAGWGRDDDVFTFTVPTGMQVSLLAANVDRSTAAWIGTPSFLTEYGFAITSSNGDLLPLWGLSSLSLGTYGMYLSDNDFQSFPTTVNYRLDFFVQAVPEPRALSLALAGLGLIGIARWKRGH
jgi:hypothetical protein